MLSLLASPLDRFRGAPGATPRNRPKPREKRLVFLLRRERRVHLGERLGRWRAPHRVRGHVARYDGSRADDGAPADSDVAEDYTMRTDVHLILDLDRRRVVGRPLGSPVEVGEDRRPHADRAVIADRNGVGMHVVDVDLLSDPNSRADSNAPQSVEPGPYAAAAGSHVCNLLQQSLNEARSEHDPGNNTQSNLWGFQPFRV